MATKTNLWSRITGIFRSEANEVLDRRESRPHEEPNRRKTETPADPMDVLSHEIAKGKDSIRKLNQTVATQFAQMREGQVRLGEEEQQADKLGLDAEKAAGKARGYPEGSVEHNHWEDLARQALVKQSQMKRRIEERRRELAKSAVDNQAMNTGLSEMKERVEGAANKLEEMKRRADSAKANGEVWDALSAMDDTDPTSEIGKIEEAIREQEALTRGRRELYESSPDRMFSQMEKDTDEALAKGRIREIQNKGALDELEAQILGASPTSAALQPASDQEIEEALARLKGQR